MDKTPYAEDFLLQQLELIVKNIKKPAYREEVNRFLENKDWFNLFKIARDRKARNYKNGILERVAALGSLALCIYDNYPTIDIDLILSAIVIAGFKDAVGKKPVYDFLKNDEIKNVAFKKSRKKHKIEYFLFDELSKIDSRVYSYLLL
ncbi:MAG: hypothetical protein ABWJ98_03535 [Hydrogenothermaceae bacterium]